MPENPQAEWKRLREEQLKARRDEVFGGLTPAERMAYEVRRRRLQELQGELWLEAATAKSAAEQTRNWNREPETDTPQSASRQPYRSREMHSLNDPARTCEADEGNLKRK